MPAPQEALAGWWGTVTDNTRTRAGPTTSAPLVGRLTAGQRVKVPTPNASPPPRLPIDRTWIVIDRSAATLTLVKQGQVAFVTYVALGKAGKDTPTGSYSTFGKLRYDDMSSATVENPTASYDLPNVPYTQYYKEGGYAIHGTYWHDAYGTQQSQGCVNLTVTDGAYLFDQTYPALSPAGNEVWASALLRPTPVVILD
jgi:lipoprotein-anchoring transpeptidase ErfK/SrfK